jgi:leucyl aminopeptidase (aminopeptidase T)
MYKDLARKIIVECFKVKAGETVLINGPFFTLPSIEAFALECIIQGANPVIMTWTDSILQEAVFKFSSHESSKIVVPDSESEEMLTGFGCKVRDVDKLILFTNPINDRTLLKVAKNKEKFAHFGNRFVKNLWNLAHFKHHFLFLDYPSQSLAKEVGLSYEECKKILYDAINVDYREIEKLNNKLSEALSVGERYI